MKKQCIVHAWRDIEVGEKATIKYRICLSCGKMQAKSLFGNKWSGIPKANRKALIQYAMAKMLTNTKAMKDAIQKADERCEEAVAENAESTEHTTLTQGGVDNMGLHFEI